MDRKQESTKTEKHEISLMVMLEQMLSKIDSIGSSLETRVDNLVANQNEITNELKTIRKENKFISNKIDKVATETASSLQKLRTVIRTDKKDLDELLDDLEQFKFSDLSNKLVCGIKDQKSISFYKREEKILTQSFDIIDTPRYGLESLEFVACNSCNSCPIEGNRYQCSKCEGFVICKNCHVTNYHKHELNFIAYEKDETVFKSQIELSISNLLRNQCDGREFRLTQTLSSVALEPFLMINSFKPAKALKRAASNDRKPTSDRKTGFGAYVENTCEQSANTQIYKDFNRFTTDKTQLF